jgi:pseudoazurin
MKKIATLVFGAVMVSGAFAAEHQIKMLNSGKDGIMAFEPGFVQAAKGDTVKFIKTDASHNSASFFAPKGAKGWKGKMDEEIVVTLTEEGVYMYQCDPHKPMAMVGVIQVGKATNLDDAKKEAATYSKSLAMNKDRLTKYLDQVK